VPFKPKSLPIEQSPVHRTQRCDRLNHSKEVRRRAYIRLLQIDSWYAPDTSVGAVAKGQVSAVREPFNRDGRPIGRMFDRDPEWKRLVGQSLLGFDHEVRLFADDFG